MKHFYSVVILFCVVMFGSQVLAAEHDLDNNVALHGLTNLSVFFDVNVGNAGLLNKRMDLIDRTITQLKQANTKVIAVIGFRSGASRFVTKEADYIIDEELEHKKAVQTWVRKFVSQGIRVEQCSLAAEQQGIAFGDFMPEVAVVKNGYVSMIGYQAKGYAVIPMD